MVEPVIPVFEPRARGGGTAVVDARKVFTAIVFRVHHGIPPATGVHRSIADPDTGGQYTVKLYTSSRVPSDDDTWRHERIILKPDSDDPGYEPIVLEPAPDDQEFAVIAEFLVVLGPA